MTDKQIKLDGVDVCRCRYYDDRYGYCDACRDDIDGNSYTKCMYEDDCYYKQLKAKEQECEELKKQHQGDKGLITSTGKMNYQLLQEYDKLKAENKRLEDLYDRVLETLEDIEIITQQGIDFFNETERHADWEKVAIFMKQQLSFILGEIEEG